MHQHPPCLTASVSKSGSVRGLNSRIVYSVGTRFAIVDAVGRNEQGKQEGSRFEASWVDRLEHDDPHVDEGQAARQADGRAGRPVPPPQTWGSLEQKARGRVDLEGRRVPLSLLILGPGQCGPRVDARRVTSE